MGPSDGKPPERGREDRSGSAGDDDRVMELLELTLAQERGEREEFLRGLCGEDAELYACVWRYVQQDEQMEGFLAEPILPALEEENPFVEGDLLEDRFRIVREVARGAMGIVYEARDETLERRVAIKCAQLGYNKRLPPEVRHAQSISHPNVCKIYDLHRAGEIDFIAMEFLEGETLAERLGRGRLRETEAAEVARQLCAGLAEAHRLQVIHGDLKASNIFLTSDESGRMRVVITDFGLARRPESRQRALQSGLLGGTPAYMAPELWKGAKATVESDIYALGILLYELTAGHRPVSPDSPRKEGTLVSEDARVVEEIRRHRWGTTILRCLDGDPERRFASVEAVYASLAGLRKPWLWTGAAAVLGMVLLAWNVAGDREVAISSIAVLPFLNTGSSQESEFLSDGLSESVLNALSHIRDLRVIARSSSEKFRGPNVDVRQAAKLLNVRAVVTGRVAQLGKNVRVDVELANGAEGRRIWGRQYNGEIAGLVRLQEEISSDVAHRIRSSLTAPEAEELAGVAGAKPEAYELLLRGRYQMRLYRPESTNRAISYFEQAVAIDPGFALAEVELANVYRRMGSAGVLRPAEALPKAEAAARRALGGARDLAEAHAVLADVKKDQWDWKAAEPEYRRALELSPNLAVARQGLAIGLSVAGRRREAIAETLPLRELDPIGTSAIDLAATYYNLRQFDDALETLRLAAERDPSAPGPWIWTGIVRGARGEYLLALEAIKKAVDRGDGSAATQCYYVFALARSGRGAEAKAVLQKLEKSRLFLPPASMAIAFTGLGERERAFSYLQKGYETRDPLMQYIGVEAHLDELHGDKRFEELSRKIGITR